MAFDTMRGESARSLSQQQAGRPESRAVAVMHEAGFDISGSVPSTWTKLIKQDFLFVITVCDAAREACPVFPGALYQLHLEF